MLWTAVAPNLSQQDTINLLALKHKEDTRQIDALRAVLDRLKGDGDDISSLDDFNSLAERMEALKAKNAQLQTALDASNAAQAALQQQVALKDEEIGRQQQALLTLGAPPPKVSPKPAAAADPARKDYSGRR